MKFKAMLTLTATLLVGSAHAQTVASSTGAGSLVQGSGNDQIKAAQLDLAANGEAVLALTGTNLPSYSFRGRWVAAGADAVRLTINNAFGDAAASGAGTATIRQGRLVVLSLNGATRGGRYAVSYQGSLAVQPSPTPTPNANPKGFSLDQNISGGGTIETAKGPAQKFDRAHVMLNKDGTAQITLRGPRTSTLMGTWKDGGRDTYVVELKSGFGSDETRGTAHVFLQRSQLAVVEAEGTSPGTGGRFKVSIR